MYSRSDALLIERACKGISCPQKQKTRGLERLGQIGNIWADLDAGYLV
jgi:hypothetical protein